MSFAEAFHLLRRRTEVNLFMLSCEISCGEPVVVTCRDPEMQQEAVTEEEMMQLEDCGTSAASSPHVSFLTSSPVSWVGGAKT